VTPFAVAKADHGVDFGEKRGKRTGIEQLVEAALGVFAHHHAIEARTNGSRIQLGGRTKVVGVHGRQKPAHRTAFGRERRGI
jgi:hypothetical protein